jgi:hypothetical protein
MGKEPERPCRESAGGLWLDVVPHRILRAVPKSERALAGLEPRERLGVCSFPVEQLVKCGTIDGCDDRYWTAAMSQKQSLAALDALDYGSGVASVREHQPVSSPPHK